MKAAQGRTLNAGGRTFNAGPYSHCRAAHSTTQGRTLKTRPYTQCRAVRSRQGHMPNGTDLGQYRSQTRRKERLRGGLFVELRTVPREDPKEQRKELGGGKKAKSGGPVEGGLRVKCTFIKIHLNRDHVHHKSNWDRTKHDSGGKNNVVRICVKASAAERNTSLQQNFIGLMRAGFRVKSSVFFGMKVVLMKWFLMESNNFVLLPSRLFNAGPCVQREIERSM